MKIIDTHLTVADVINTLARCPQNARVVVPCDDDENCSEVVRIGMISAPGLPTLVVLEPADSPSGRRYTGQVN